VRNNWISAGNAGFEGSIMKPDKKFWKNKRVLLTGHTGFKGSWLSLWLTKMGAQVHGFSLAASDTSLFNALQPWQGVQSAFGDLCDRDAVMAFVQKVQPEIVFHMAAQALVRPGYADPVGTIATNVLGTAHLLDALREISNLEAVVVITSDKAYENDGSGKAFAENDPLGGADPYSGSKGGQEIIAHLFRRSYFMPQNISLATARAGNVVGGGDWSADRLVPDLIRAAYEGRSVRIRHPQSTRPWQHVLDPLAGYLLYAEKLAKKEDVPSALNFAPSQTQVQTVATVADRVIAAWPEAKPWARDNEQGPAEAKTLTLDASLAKKVLNWELALNFEETLDWTVAWYRAYAAKQDMRDFTSDQIDCYFARLSA